MNEPIERFCGRTAATVETINKSRKPISNAVGKTVGEAKKKGPVFGFSHVDDNRVNLTAGQRYAKYLPDGGVVLTRSMVNDGQRHSTDITRFRANYVNLSGRQRKEKYFE